MAGFGDALSKFGKSIVDGTKNTAKSVNLSAEIEGLESKVKRAYMELGEKYFELFSETPAEALKEKCDEIARMKADIESKKTEKLGLAGKKVCPFCETPVDANVPFCPTCGKNMQMQEGDVIDSTAQAKFCSSCGKPLSPGAAFCGSCGAKVE